MTFNSQTPAACHYAGDDHDFVSCFNTVARLDRPLATLPQVLDALIADDAIGSYRQNFWFSAREVLAGLNISPAVLEGWDEDKRAALNMVTNGPTYNNVRFGVLRVALDGVTSTDMDVLQVGKVLLLTADASIDPRQMSALADRHVFYFDRRDEDSADAVNKLFLMYMEETAVDVFRDAGGQAPDMSNERQLKEHMEKYDVVWDNLLTSWEKTYQALQVAIESFEPSEAGGKKPRPLYRAVLSR